MFWKLPLPFLLATTSPSNSRKSISHSFLNDPKLTEAISALHSVYDALEVPATIHWNVTDTMRFNLVPSTTNSHDDNKKKPVALYVPGLDGYGISAVPQWDDMANAFELWTLFLSTDDRSSLEQVVDAIQAFLHRQQQQEREQYQPVTLIGESTGGVLALLAALQASTDQLKGLILINPATSFDQTGWKHFIPLLTMLPSNISGGSMLSPYAVHGSLLLSSIVPDRQQVARILRQTLNTNVPLLSLGNVLRTTTTLIASMKNVEQRLPPALLKHRVEQWLEKGLPHIHQQLHTLDETVPTLLVVGNQDALLPSKREAQRLQKALGKNACVLNVPNRGHFVLDDSVNLTEAILFSHIFQTKPYDRILDWRLPRTVHDYIQHTVQPIRTLFSPVYFSTDPQGKRWSGMSQLPQKKQSATPPIVFVGNHQFAGADLQLLVGDLFEQRGIVARGLAHPVNFVLPHKYNFAHLDGRIPGLVQDTTSILPLTGGFEKFGAVPVTPLNYYRLLQTGQTVLLFPGGAAEALSSNKSYPLLWPDKVDFVRTAARFNATIVPLSAIGMLDSFNVQSVPKELQSLDFLQEEARRQIANMTTARYDEKLQDAIVEFPPIAVPGMPQRNYFIFGTPIDTTTLDPKDKAACAKTYQQAKDEVQRGLNDLLDLRQQDPYRSTPTRLLRERILGKRAPTFAVSKLN